MPYRFAVAQQDYTDYAGGRVFYSLPGQPAFPARLISEIFQRCQVICQAAGNPGPYTLYDPCCGGAYHLCVLTYLHGEAIKTIIASDIDADVLALARRNLNLLTPTGLQQRIAEIQTLYTAYNKPSHKAAIESARRLERRLGTWTRPVSIHTFQADVTDRAAVAQGINIHTSDIRICIDIVLTDIPYGQLTTWQSGEDTCVTRTPVWRMLESLRHNLPQGVVVAVASDKRQKIAHEAYRRVEQFQIGKRRVAVLRIKS